MKVVQFAAARLLRHAPIVYPAARMLVGPYDRLELALHDMRDIPLFLVYSIGRVASTSVYESLVEARPGLPVYDVHMISRAQSDAAIAKYHARGKTPARILYMGRKIGESLERRRRRGGLSSPWKVFTIFREPIGSMLSHIFLKRGHELIAADGAKAAATPEDVLQKIRRLEGDDPSGWKVGSWFEDTLAEELGIDVYETPFDHARGFTVIRNDEFHLALVKFESLKTAFAPAVEALLDRPFPGLQLKYTNFIRNTRLDVHHAYVKQNLKFSGEFCDQAYGTKFMQHFYSDAERSRLKAKWSDDTTGKVSAAGAS